MRKLIVGYKYIFLNRNSEIGINVIVNNKNCMNFLKNYFLESFKCFFLI